jgi:hypothetical protein
MGYVQSRIESVRHCAAYARQRTEPVVAFT